MDTADGVTGAGSRSLNRRELLGGIGTVGAIAIAGCSSGAGSGGDDGAVEEDIDTGSGDPRSDTGADGSGGDTDGDGTPGDGPAGIGDLIRGEYLSVVIEYVQPVQTVLDFSRMPQRSEAEPYGTPRTIDYYTDRGVASSGDSLYAIGIAMQNVHGSAVDASTVSLRTEDTLAVPTFPARSQSLSLVTAGRTSGRPMVPGEVVRGELTAALPVSPEEYTLHLQPMEVGSGRTEQHLVDLGAGAPGGTTFTQSPRTEAMDQPVAVGDFEATLHSVERVPSITDSPHQSLFGPRPGYEYVRIDLSATRTSDVMIGQGWSLGASDDEGHVFSWGQIYQNALALNSGRFEQLAVGESISNVTFAFPIAEDFEPTLLSMTGLGPVEDPPRYWSDRAIQRVFWSLP